MIAGNGNVEASHSSIYDRVTAFRKLRVECYSLKPYRKGKCKYQANYNNLDFFNMLFFPHRQKPW